MAEAMRRSAESGSEMNVKKRIDVRKHVAVVAAGLVIAGSFIVGGVRLPGTAAQEATPEGLAGHPLVGT